MKTKKLRGKLNLLSNAFFELIRRGVIEEWFLKNEEHKYTPRDLIIDEATDSKYIGFKIEGKYRTIIHTNKHWKLVSEKYDFSELLNKRCNKLINNKKTKYQPIRWINVYHTGENLTLEEKLEWELTNEREKSAEVFELKQRKENIISQLRKSIEYRKLFLKEHKIHDDIYTAQIGLLYKPEDLTKVFKHDANTVLLGPILINYSSYEPEPYELRFKLKPKHNPNLNQSKGDSKHSEGILKINSKPIAIIIKNKITSKEQSILLSFSKKHNLKILYI